jgi:hypothetical protein
MDVALLPYKQHFEEYGCNFYKLKDQIPVQLSSEERYLLSTVGLPDAALPFFHFDLCIGMLRDIAIEDSILIIGTGIDPASYNYLYVNADHKVYVYMEDGSKIFINNSLRQMIHSIFVYSTWLESLEDRFFVDDYQEVGAEDIFELYYQLRLIDPDAVREKTIWHQLINTEIRFENCYDCEEA